MKGLRLSLFFTFSLIFSNLLMAQKYSLAADSAVIITITGTSTLHGWTVVANEIKDVPQELTLTGAEGNTIDNFSFGVVVASLDGGRGASMNTKITDALKATENPVITYVQSESSIFPLLEADGTFTLLSKGKMNIAGTERAVEILVSGKKSDNGLILKGSKPLKFSELGIEPPSAMFGQIVCGDDISVNFEFRYN